MAVDHILPHTSINLIHTFFPDKKIFKKNWGEILIKAVGNEYILFT
jgi:hypothetical protein